MQHMKTWVNALGFGRLSLKELLDASFNLNFVSFVETVQF